MKKKFGWAILIGALAFVLVVFVGLVNSWVGDTIKSIGISVISLALIVWAVFTGALAIFLIEMDEEEDFRNDEH